MENRMSELENLVETKYRNIAGIKVVKKGQCMYETYFNGFGPEDTIHVMSVTKSILSALTGIAIDRGHIQSADQKVLDFFPDYTPKRGEKTIQNVTIKNLLTMTAPYKYQSEPYTKVYTSADWTRAALDLLGGRAGITGAFQYSTVGIQILSGILANATGMPVRDFAAEYLFTPLGIKTPDNTILHNKEEHFAFLKERHPSGWVVDPKGVNTAGWGLCLTLCDMVKFGELYAKEGLFRGKRILSSSWIRESTREKSRWGELPYGYLWWIIDYRGSHCYAAIGDGGNAVFVCPELELVAAVASCFVQRAEIPILELLTGRIVPMFV
nr:serine hydrolase [uncultured Eisenbergiella sp.]